MTSHQRDPHEPVAIVGMGCQWPGGVRDGSQFWEFLRDKADGWKEFDDPRFSTRGYHHPNADRPGSVAMKGAFLADEDARLFDHAFFGMTGLEVETMDPSQRKLLEVAYEAMENAGETWESVSGSRTGVFVGNFCLDHWMIQSRDWDNPRPYAFTGAGTSILANRISYIFNLQGPSLTIDTACSSSMYALHLAVNAIRAGDCDSAIVASANWIADPGVQIALDKLGALSASSRCHTFDARADGGQEVVIREAYRNAGHLPFGETSYFECHGTGTYVGDPIEVAALGSVFAPDRSADDPLLVGSVKSNVGHGEGASALASIMKVVLALEHGAIPPVFNIETLNPNIAFDAAKVQPVTEVTPWPKERLQRASINSFGYGGANGHCILDHVNNVLPDYVAPGVYQHKANGTANGHTNGHTNGHEDGVSIQHSPIVKSPRLTATANAATRQLVLLPLSAHNEHSLELNLDALSQVIDKISLADVVYTLGARRSRFAQRSFRIVDKVNVAQSLEQHGKIVRAPLQTVNLGFIFTGQGAQWHAIQYLDYVLGALPNPPSWSLQNILSGDCDAILVQTAEISQAVCTAVQVGIVDLLASWSVRPSGVAGHSSGEIAAAYASGRITAAEAIIAAYFRGQAVSRNKQAGAMLAVGLGWDQVARYLEGRQDEVKVAAINSPGSVTLSGEPTAIDEISAVMTADSIFNRRLETGGNAYHSHHMVPIGREYVEILTEGIQHTRKLGLASAKQRYQHVPWISSVTPSKSTAEFNEAVASLVDSQDVPIHALVEIGPHPALKSPLDQILKAGGKTVAYASTLKRQEDGRRSMLQLAGTLFSLNASVDLAAVNAVDETDDTGLEHGCTCIELPPYKYTYGGLNYHESRASKEYRHRPVVRHDLLGSKVVGNAKLRPQWRNILRIKDVPWLGDHRLVPDAVLPGAGYIAMAVEAASRVYDEFPEPLTIKGFCLRDVAIKKSLVIPEDDYGVEVLTSMELADVATAQSPAWATFSISSVGRETNEWTEHSTGRVQIQVEVASQDFDQHQVAPRAPRGVNARAWYKKFLDAGLGYGPAFQPLSDIRTDPASNLGVATVVLHPTTIKGGESRYALHPASLDGAIQLGLIACHGGRLDEASTAFVPVHLSRLYLANDIVGDTCTVVARGERRGIRSAYLDLQMLGSNGEVLLNVDTLRCVSFSKEAKTADRSFASPFTRLVWKPDIRTLSNRQARQIFPPPKANVEKSHLWGILDKLVHFVVLSMYESFGKLRDGPTPSGDVGHFFDWIRRKGQDDHSPLMEEARDLVNNGLLQKIEDLVSQAPDVIEVKIAKLLHDNAADILFERRTGMDIIIGEDLLTPLYRSGLLMTGIYPQLLRVLSGLAHANPNLRVLEIGGGTGGATRIAMKAFNGPNGIKAYHDYTFTDISPGFLSSARASMADLRDMNFSVFDAEVEPADQGYEQAYDLIIACQVLHATSNMRNTLSNCRKLLRPGGRLVLVETTQNFIVPGVVVGTFTGYWAGIPDGRVDAPFQSLDAWNSSLREAGFSGLDLVLDDFPEPHNTTSVILSTVLPETANLPQPATAINVLHGGRTAQPLVEHISKELNQRGFVAKAGALDEALDDLAPESRVIALLDEKYLLANADEQALKVVQHLARNSASLVALTSCGLVKGRNADGALIAGLLRVLQNENPASQYVIVDQELKLGRSTLVDDDEGDPKDHEFSYHDGCLWVSRHVPDAGFHSQHGLDSRGTKPELLPLSSQGGVRAAFATHGVLNSLCFMPYKELLQPLPPDFIDVAVAAVGVNRRDLDQWTGRLDVDHLSSEYAGIVTAVGACVDGFKIGDRVYGLGKGQLGNRTRVPAAFAGKLQPRDTMAQMATMPLAYTTAIYAFDHIAHLRKGQSVLVQSGASDVGIASIRLAKAKGAHVFATVETPEQRSFLIDELAMSASHVIRAPSFTDLRRAAQMTPKAGFEVIVSTARGELLSSFLQVLAPLGRLIDVGRVEVQAARKTSLELLPHSATFASIDPFAILDLDPALGAELMQAADGYYRSGLIGPIQKITAPDVAHLSSELDDFPNIIGKLVISFENTESSVMMIPSAPAVKFDSESCYAITGALGGLGQSLIRWMGDRGARHMALLSRRHVSSVSGAQELVDSLAGRDIHVECHVCDVSKKDQVMRVMQQISSHRPIKGVVHAAVSYLDLTFERLSPSRWNDGLSAKVEGTKNLHEATLSMPLDFFVMTTSALSVFAFATQGAYTAANNFQDAFARHRRQMGLPASTISSSLIRDVTNVGTDSTTVNLFERNKALTLSESQFLALVEPAFLDNKTADKTSPEQWFGQESDPLSAANLHTYLDPSGLVARMRHDMRQSIPVQTSLDEGSKNTIAHLRSELDAAIREGPGARASAVALVQSAIINVVAEMLFVDVESIDPAKSVADLGVDSLIAAELRNWFLLGLGTNISMLDLLDPSVSISMWAASIIDKGLSAKAETE
ncbi:polyketide synthase dehydratase domain-containing protein [Hirsutella rhossiliensis]|uniref:Polyketide synthase dehydratase domain-containing protein n=1 Tax=Hirsutella rhossiliensis TaxID=111463 RepID=A0A9P8MZ85_9HYPO|nr:polyketide synthase dehydratase domain-containing protein [Hirsutella rhossiliensis]KAH0964015.1 polyketide synthase dehydratase domain-containing protein [Hirsutella rhossiliensis]